MTAGSLARRYAKALLSIAVDGGKVDQLGDELRQVADVLGHHRGLRLTMGNPSYPLSQRRKVLDHVLSRIEVTETIRSFVFLLLDRNRIDSLSEIAHAYGALADKHLGRVRAHVVSAVALDPATVNALRDELSASTAKSVVLTTETDPELIAGMVTHVECFVLDGSLRSQLDLMRQTLLEGEA